jgi:hypothetical protein
MMGILLFCFMADIRGIPQKTTSEFPYDEKNDEKNQWNIIVSKK